MIKIIEKEPCIEYSRWYSRYVTYTSVFWVGDNGKEHFVYNRVSNTGRSFDEEENGRKIARMIEILENTGLRYMPIYLKSWHTHFPVEDAENFLQWKNEHGYTFDSEMCDRFMDDDDNECVYFSGNINEYSAAFRFAIYDPSLIAKWDDALRKDSICV